MKLLHMAAFSLVVVGALNGGLVALLGLNLVNLVFGSLELLEKLVYLLIALSAVVLVVQHKADCKTC